MKTKTIVIMLVFVCGALAIVAIASCAGLFLLTFRSMDAALSPTLDELFTAIANDRFPDTYDTHTTPEFREIVTRKQYEELGLLVKTRLGSLKFKNLVRFNVGQLNTSRYADVVYTAL